MNIAIIPARGGSKRIPRKNVREFFGRPIIAYSIEAAQKSGVFDEIIVSTDAPEIADTAKALGASVPFIRSQEISDDYATILDVLKHAVGWLEEFRKAPDFVCCIYATAPFVASSDIVRGLKVLNQSTCGSSLSVAKFNYPIQRALKEDGDGALRMFQPEHAKTRSQDLPEAYMDAAQFIWSMPQTLLACEDSLFEQGVAPVVLPTHRVQDIDTIEDWVRAELVFEALHNQRQGK